MEKVFGIIPANSGALTTMWVIIAVVGVILIGVIALFISITHQAGHATFKVTDEGLRISPGLYGRFIPRQDIDSGGMKLINLKVDQEYRLKWRTNGVGLPGYNAGWFKLANKEKALAFVTDKSRVVYIPTRKDYVVLLSVQEAEEFSDLLWKWQ